MNSSNTAAPIRNDVLEEAAGWLVECRTEEVGGPQRREFDAWLRASPEHVRAYLSLLPLWETSAQLDLKAHPDVDTLIGRAREGSANVIPLGRAATDSRPSTATVSPSSRFKLGRLMALAASVVLTLVGAWLYSQRDTYATAIGEQRSIALPDGSVVEMNAMSRIRVRFSQPERRIDLLAGQALFRVAHDTARPFVVYSDAARIRAVGTEFDVYRKSSGTIVTVVEGRVAVLADSSFPEQKVDPAQSSISAVPEPSPNEPVAAAQPGKIYVSAGEQVILTPRVTPTPVPANLSAATAWTQRRLIFSATPLPEAAAEFNRYNARQLIIDAPGLESFRINGVFSSTNPAALLGFLREQPGITVIETDREIRVNRK